MTYNPYEDKRRAKMLADLQRENDRLRDDLNKAVNIISSLKFERSLAKSVILMTDVLKRENEDLRTRMTAIQDFVNAKNTHDLS